MLTADKAYINNNEGSKDAGLREHDEVPHIGYWLDNEASVEWQFRTKEPGTFEVHAELSVQEEKTRFSVGLVDAPLMVEVESTGGYGKYKKMVLGKIEITEAGNHVLRVKPDPAAWNPMNLRNIELRVVAHPKN